MSLEAIFAGMTLAQKIMLTDMAFSRIISAVVKMAEDSGDEATIEELKANADKMDADRAAAMAGIYARQNG